MISKQGQSMTPYQNITTSQYEALVATDTVLQFVERVNGRAVTDPIWRENYALALYRTFVEEARKRVVELQASRGRRDNPMSEKRIEVRTIMVRLMCDKCLEGEMQPTGMELPTYPAQYPHRCDRCGFVVNVWGHIYPRTEYEQVQPNPISTT